jgi:periplasmic protein CpxP/Spy
MITKMKKQILLTLFAFTVAISSISAQGGFQRRTPEERAKVAHDKIDSAFKLDAEKMAKVDSIFLDSYKQQDAKMEEIRASGSFDREAMRTAREELMNNRDAKLKEVFTEEQMKKFKDEIEPSMRPQRGGGNRNN